MNRLKLEQYDIMPFPTCERHFVPAAFPEQLPVFFYNDSSGVHAIDSFMHNCLIRI